MPVRFASAIGGSFKFVDGNDMPIIGLGTSRMSQEKLTAAVLATLQAGYRLFDTARAYENEHLLGVAFKETLPRAGLKREDIFITTKVPIANEDPAGFTRKSIAESLEKLQTDYLDLVLIHYPRDRDAGADDDEKNAKNRRIVWETLEEIMLTTTSIRSLGVSNYEIYHLDELAQYAKTLPVLNQCEYHPYSTLTLLRRYCAKKRIVFQAYSSLVWGNTEILEEPAVKGPAEKYGVTPQIILYAFGVLNNASIIPKSETPSRIVSNLNETIKVELSPEELAALAALNRNASATAERGNQPLECV